MSRRSVHKRSWLLLPAGFVVWAAAFLSLYGMLSIGCASGWNDIELTAGLTLQRALLVAIFLFFVAAGGFLARAIKRAVPSRADGASPDGFVLRTSYWLSIAAIAATAFTFAGTLTLSPCLG